MSKIGCAGILVADTVCGPLEELPPEGQLLSVDALPAHVGGCAANVAIGLRKQGLDVEIAGCVGQDANAQLIIDALIRGGVGCAQLKFTDAYPTSQTIILLVKGQDRRYIHVFGANKAFSVGHISRAWLTTLKVFYLGGLFVLPSIQIADLRDLLHYCRSQGILTLVDVVTPQHFAGLNGLDSLLPYIDFFVPNNDEAAALTGATDPLEQLRRLRGYGANTVIIKHGEAGLIAAHEHELWRSNAFKVATLDPSGGGDAFTAGIITGLAHGWDFPTTLALGSALGASATMALGTTDGVFTADEAAAFLASHSLSITHEALD